VTIPTVSAGDDVTITGIITTGPGGGTTLATAYKVSMQLY
jgi:hypothetical protein